MKRMNDSLLIAADSCAVSSGLHLFPPLLMWLSTGSEPTQRGATTPLLVTRPWTLSTGKNTKFISNSKSRISNKNPILIFIMNYLKKLQSLGCVWHFVMFIIMWPQHRHEKNISLVSPSIIIPVLFIWTNKSIKAAGASGGVLLLAKPQVLDALIFNTAWYETAAVAGVSHPPWHNILQLHTTQPYHADCGICLHPQRWPFALTLKMNRMIFRNVLWSDINI